MKITWKIEINRPLMKRNGRTFGEVYSIDSKAENCP